MQTLKPFQFTAVSDTLTGVTATAATDLINKVGHGLVTGTPFIPTGFTGADGLTMGRRYYAIRIDDDTFKAALTRALAIAGTAIDITVNGTVGVIAKPTKFKSEDYLANGVLFLPQTDGGALGAGNDYTAYLGHRNATLNNDPRTPIPIANQAFNRDAVYNLADLYVLTASGDGVDVFGYLIG